MQDLIYVVALIAFFAVGALYVFGCNRIIGSDEKALAEGEGRLMDNLVGVIIAALIVAYLVYAILRPEGL